MTFSDTALYAVEGQEDAEVYSFSLSSDVEYPVDVVVSLPNGMPQGSIALYNSSTESIVGDSGTELVVSLTDAADSTIEVAFFPSDDGLVEGVHSIDIVHSIVSANVEEPVFAGSVQMEITDINTYDAGIIVSDPITGALEEEFPIQEGTISMVPISLAAPSDQDVFLTLSPEDAKRLQLTSNVITFSAGETGPKMVEVTVPDDGKYTGGDLTSLTFVSSSISPPYNGLSFTLPIPILEERAIGLTVKAQGDSDVLELNEANGGYGTFEVQLASEPTAPLSIRLEDPTNSVTFFPGVLELEPGPASAEPFPVSVIATQPGFSGTVNVTAVVESDGDELYDGLTSSVFTIIVENTAPPELLVERSTTELKEGSPVTVRVALSKTSPTEDVTVAIHPSWTEGIPRDIDLSTSTVVFPAGSKQQWQEITINAPYAPEYYGNAQLELVLTSFSDDPLYSSISGVGLTPESISFVTKDIDIVGVCLSNCAPITKYDFLFAESTTDPVETPYEVLGGVAELKFKLRTQPLGDIQLQIDAVLVDGSAAVVLPTSLDTQPARRSDGSPLSLPFSTSTWSTISRAMLQASLDKPGVHDAKVLVSGRCLSEVDPFYNGLEFSFLVGIRPAMTGPAVSTTVQNALLPTTIKTIDGIDTVFQPLSLPTNTELSILPVEDGDLACSLENPKTRFRPFGYKEMTSNPPQERLEKPSRVYWQIPARFRSLDQLKFLTLPSKDSCDWTLKAEIELETRVGDDGELEYWAYTHLDGLEVFSLAQVEPLISEPEIPHIMTYTEGENAQAISPWLGLNVKEDNEWNVKYPSLRVRSMSIAVDEGYIKGEDILKLPGVPGFESTWDDEHGVLTVSAIPGFDFTDDTIEDYEEGQVELVDVTEVINTVEASAKLTDFQEVLRMVQFETTSGGSLRRKMSLSANELLTSDTIATITMATLINTPDPPEVIPSPDALIYKEKTPLTPLDSNVQALHPDGIDLREATVWIEPASNNDVVMYQQSYQPPSGVFVSFVPSTKTWAISGIAATEIYSSILQDMHFQNNGPVVEVNGSPNRTVLFRVEDINGRTATAKRNIVIRQVVDPPVVTEIMAKGLQDMPITGTLSAIDPEGRPITLSLADCRQPMQGTMELGEPTADGRVPFTYTPDEKSFGLDSFLFIASNGDTVNAGLMTMDIENADDPPVAEEHHVIVYSGRNTTFSLPAYDPDGTPVEIYILREPQGAAQVLRLTNEEPVGLRGQRRKGLNPVTVSFPDLVTPDYAVVFSYVARDILNNKISEEALVHVLVRSPGYWNTIMQNQPPTAKSATFQLDQGDALEGRIEATDDFDTADQLTYSVSSQPMFGIIELDGPDFTYVPNRGAFGQDTFTVKVQDGMLAEAEAFITVDIAQVNAEPLPACEDGIAGLFDSTWPALRALTAYGPSREGLDLQSVIQELILEKDQALSADPLKLQTRSQALELLARDVTLGKVLDGPNAAFELACSRAGSWALPMVESDQMHLTALNVSILAYDPDELEGLLYRITEPPMHGSLYASTALGSTSYREASAQTYITIGDNPYRAGKVDSKHSAYVLNEPGQPLYLQYRPDPLLRGKPADSVAWAVVDKWGKSAPESRIDIDIECSPGFFFEESSPSFCAPCPAGSYNFPDAHDQMQCIPCPAGTFCSAAGMTAFDECPPGSFQEEIGSTQCSACPDNGMHTEPGATSQLDCQCPAGTFVFGWDGLSATQECRVCNSERQLCDETHQIIPKPSSPGIWINPNDGSAHDCLPYDACLQHTEEEAVLLGTCSDGYQGFSCSECSPEHYRDDDTLCKKCNDYVWVFYTLGIVAALVLAPLVMNVSKSHGFMSINIFIGTMQITTQIQKLELDWPEQIRAFFQTLNLLSLSLSALSPRCVVSDWQYLNKVPITNAAPIGIFAFLLIHQYVVPRVSHALRTVCKALLPSIMAPTKEKAQLEDIKFHRLESRASEVGREEIPLSERFCRFFLVAPPESVVVQDFRGCLRTVTPAMLVVLSWTYVGLANVNMEFFNCSYRSGKYYLAAEPSVECYDFSSWNQHTTMFPICALGMIVYVLGIPVLFGYLLYRNRQILRHRHGLLEVLQLQKDASKGPGTTPHNLVLGQLDVQGPVNRLKSATEMHGFLFRHYQEKSFWWEMIVLLRKLGFAVIVHQPKAPEQQTMLGILCLLSYISLVTGVRPYAANYLNWMDILGAAFATSLAFSGLVMFGGYDTQLSTDTASIIQIVLVLLLVAFLSGFVVFDSIPKVRLHLRLRRQRNNLIRLKQRRSMMEAQAAATWTVGKAAMRFKRLRNRMSGNPGKAESGSRPVTPTEFVTVRQSSTPPQLHENVVHQDPEEMAINNMQSHRVSSEREISFSTSTKFTELSTKQPATASTFKAPAMRGVSEDSSLLSASLPEFAFAPRTLGESAAPKAPPKRYASANEHSILGGTLNSAPLVPDRGSEDGKFAMKGKRGTSASTSGREKRRSFNFSAGIARRSSLVRPYEDASAFSFHDNGKRPISGRMMNKIESLVGLSKFEPEAPEREIKTLEENLAALRFAAIVTISPLRAKIIKVFRRFLEPEDHEMVARWMLRTDRTEKDLAEVQWVVGLLEKLNRGETSPASAEYEAVKGIESLVGRLRRSQDQGAARGPRAGHRRLPSRQRSSVENLMSLNPQRKESAKVNDADTEQAKHIAELLEIAGATKINAAVELRLAAMKINKKSKITKLASAARRASSTGAQGGRQAMEGGMATALAASRLKARVKATKEKEATTAADLVANISLREMQGPKAGPLRWVFHRRLLLDIWEWNSFQSQAWHCAFIYALARRVNDEFSDEKIQRLREYVMVKRDQRKTGKIMTSARHTLEMITGSSSLRASDLSATLIKSFGWSWQPRRGPLPPVREGPSSGSASEANGLLPPAEATASASVPTARTAAMRVSCEVLSVSSSGLSSSMASANKPTSGRRKSRPLSTRTTDLDHVLPELLSPTAGDL